MATAPQMPKKKHSRPPRSRPVATSSISQPPVEDAWSSSVLSAFSPDTQLFAFLSLAVDKHRLRVFDVSTSQSIAEHIVVQTRVTSLAWISFDATVQAAPMDGESLPSKKRKKLLDESKQTSSSSNQGSEWAVGLGLSDGHVQVFSVRQARVVVTLSETGSKSAVLAIADNGAHDGSGPSIWTSSLDGALRLWDVSSGKVLVNTHKSDSQYSALAVRPGIHQGRTHILAGRSEIRLLSLSVRLTSRDDSHSEEPVQNCSFSGHPSIVKSVVWEHSAYLNRRFFSSAEDDRFIYLWEVPDPLLGEGNLVASCPLEADVLQIDAFSLAGRQVLLALARSGKVTIFTVPNVLGGKAAVPTLAPRTIINLSKRSPSDIRIASATFLRGESGKVCMALIAGGVKVAFETLAYAGDDGEFIPELTVKPSASAFGSMEGANRNMISNKRYSEPSGLAVATGSEAPLFSSSLDAITNREVEGVLNADLAELSLGERLAARSDTVVERRILQELHPSERSADVVRINGMTELERRRRRQVPSHSLTRTLIQALHADDRSLLEACLTHSDEALVHSTVSRLPAQLAVPLLNACVERLGRGARGNNLKGRGGGASAQRGLSLTKWVRAVLVIHSGHLMTMPDLVSRLSYLHSTLSARLALQERLLSLSGRLDLVLAQAELRSSNAPGPYPSKKATKHGKTQQEPVKYVEGESSEEESEGEELQMEVENDQGSVEDVELQEGSEQDSEEHETEDDESGDSDDANVLRVSMDEEGEEDYDEESWEEDSD